MNPFSTIGGADALGELDNSEGRQLGRLSHDIEGALKALVHDPDFPCVGAKSVVNQESYSFGLYPELGDERSAAALAYDLYEFIQARPSMVGEFTSYIAAFVEPKVRDERQFEKLLWRQLALLHELDRRFFTCGTRKSAPIPTIRPSLSALRRTRSSSWDYRRPAAGGRGDSRGLRWSSTTTLPSSGCARNIASTACET